MMTNINDKKKKCYIYTRVSTTMQIDGYSLDAQKDRLRKYADFQDMEVVRTYSDEGKSGKNTAGRLEFQQMIDDIKNYKDNVDYVLVYKLSRFSRSASDAIYNLAIMEDYGVALFCLEESIDTSKDTGKLLFSIISAIAEMEAENIRAMTKLGRSFKAQSGGWNGSQAPFGYQLINKELHIDENEKRIVEIIFDKFVNERMSLRGIADWLNEHGYKKPTRHNSKLDYFTPHFVGNVITNHIYCGKIAYGKRRVEKIKGAHNKFHIVRQDEYPVYDGIHEAIVSEELWVKAQDIKYNNAKRHTFVKKYNEGSENLLSGLIKCPECGNPLYGNVNRKKHPNGGFYKEYFYYFCRRTKKEFGCTCTFNRQIKQELIDKEIENLIINLGTNPQFVEYFSAMLGKESDLDGLYAELEQLEKSQQQYIAAKTKIGTSIDLLDPESEFYEEKLEDLEYRLNSMYKEISDVMTRIEELKARISSVEKKNITVDSVQQLFKGFDKFHNKFTDLEKKKFYNLLIEDIQINPEFDDEIPILKSVTFRLPFVLYEKIDKDTVYTPEYISLLCKTMNQPNFAVEYEIDKGPQLVKKRSYSYKKIKEYAIEKHGVKLSNLEIAQIKRMHGLIERDNYNESKNNNYKAPRCTKEKEIIITNIFRELEMI